jgi:PEP-CTERM motif
MAQAISNGKCPRAVSLMQSVLTLPIATLAGLQINFSTTTRAVDGLSSIFAENVGLDNTVVFDLSAITLSDFQAGGADIIIPLRTPFYYDPSAGNLLMDVFNFGRERTSPFNANSSASDTTSSVYSFGVNEPNGIANTIGLVTIFEVRPVPEPSTWALLAVGLLLGGVRHIRRGNSFNR